MIVNKENSNLKIIDFYNDSGWGEKDINRNFLLQREVTAINLIKSKIKENDYFLDIGCSYGIFLSKLDHILKKKINYFGVDYSNCVLEIAKKLPYTFSRCNVEEGLPFDNQIFNFIYAGELIEHLYNPDYFLSECHRVLKNNGYIIISTPNLSSWHSRIIFLLGVQPIFYEISVEDSQLGFGFLKKLKKSRVPVGHIRLFNKNSLTDILNYKGFNVLKTVGSNFPAFPNFLRHIDNFFNLSSSLASNITIIAKKITKD